MPSIFSRAPWSFVVALVVAFVAFGCGGAALPPSAESPLLGASAPPIQEDSLAHGAVDTAALRGRVVVVKFFAEYCKPCKKTLPAIQRIAKERPEIVVIGVSEDEEADTARQLVDQYGLSFPVIVDRFNLVWGKYQGVELPVTFVLDRDGTVAWVGGPQQTEAELEKAIAALAN